MQRQGDYNGCREERKEHETFDLQKKIISQNICATKLFDPYALKLCCAPNKTLLLATPSQF